MTRPLWPLVVALALAACSSSHKDDTRDDWDIQKINAQLGRGVNLGNALDSPGFEGAWGLTLDESYFIAIAQRGFQSIRLPVRFSDHMLTTPPYTIDSAFLARVDWAIECAKQNHLSIILDVHHFLALMDNPDANQEMWLSLWEQLSVHYESYGSFLVFEPLNEPTGMLGPTVWNDFIAAVVPLIRRTNPKRAIILGSASYSSVNTLPLLQLPVDDHLIASVHYYNPFSFTHQGASWVPGAVNWLGTIFRNEDAYTAPLKADFDRVANWQKETGRPITIGEFGSIIYADLTSRAIYAATLSKEFTTRGWSFAYWNFGADFAIYDTATGEFIPDLADALISPDTILARPVSETEPTPPDGPSVLVDDFEDALGDAPEQGAIAAQKAKTLGIPFADSPGNWAPFANPDTTLTSADGTVLVTFESFQSTGTPLNVSEAIGATGHPGHSFSMGIHLKGDQYPYAGMICVFSGQWKRGFYDLSNLTAISFWARGKGAMRATLVPDAVVNGYPDKDAWGFFGTEFLVKSEWHRYVVLAKDLKPKPYSPQERDKLTWDQVQNKIGAIHFEVGQSYGQVADVNLELEVDEIRLHGVTMDTFLAPDADWSESTADGGASDASGD